MNLSGAWWNPMAWEAPFPVVTAALFVIVCLRAGATYALGRFAASGGRRTRVGAIMERPGFVRSAERIHRVGAPVVAMSFLTIGVQTMVNFSAGFLRMPLWRYLPSMAIGAVMWALVYASVGFVGLKALALAWRQHPLLAVLLLAGFVGVMAALMFRRPATETDPAHPRSVQQ
ncbi:VTT domain-containing protein [Luteococcus sp. H138]|uniref:DedA family protein n=1 Tax=unclassified Luteococcus TaxID=2639923 RepID=UPI00313D7C72